MMERNLLSDLDVLKLNSKKGLQALLSQELYNPAKAIRFIDYEKKLKKLQVELVKLQSWVIDNNERIIIIFEGRDAAGKGGAIRRTVERINPRHIRIVALPKPTEEEKTQWYFQRYVNQFPKAGQMVFLTEVGIIEQLLNQLTGFVLKKNMRFL